MNAELLQLLYYAGFTLLGWWLRHRGILGPKPASPNGNSPLWPIDQKTLLDLLKALLDRLGQQSPAAPSGTPAGHVITVPFEVAATPRVPPSGN